MVDTAVILAVYKNDKLEFVKEALESIYNQTYKNLHIYIQEDGIVNKELDNYLENELKENRIYSLKKREINKGFPYTLNELIERTKNYKYIVRMDADDISRENRIKKQINILKTNKKIDICGSWIEEFGLNSKQIIKYPEKNKDILRNFAIRTPVAHVTVVFRSDVFKKVSKYNIKYLNEDQELWIRCFEKNLKFYNIQEPLVNVRINKNFYSRRRNIKRAIEVMTLKIKSTKKFKFGIKGYLFSILHFVLFISPYPLQRIIYKYLR